MRPFFVSAIAGVLNARGVPSYDYRYRFAESGKKGQEKGVYFTPLKSLLVGFFWIERFFCTARYCLLKPLVPLLAFFWFAWLSRGVSLVIWVSFFWGGTWTLCSVLGVDNKSKQVVVYGVRNFVGFQGV